MTSSARAICKPTVRRSQSDVSGARSRPLPSSVQVNDLRSSVGSCPSFGSNCSSMPAITVNYGHAPVTCHVTIKSRGAREHTYAPPWGAHTRPLWGELPSWWTAPLASPRRSYACTSRINCYIFYLYAVNIFAYKRFQDQQPLCE